MKNTILAAALMLALPIGVSAETAAPNTAILAEDEAKTQSVELEVTGMT